MLDPNARSAHRDTFVRDHLPPRELWPKLEYTLPELKYPRQLNCAVELLDENVERGAGNRTAFHFPGGRCTYAELLELANSIANSLVGMYGLAPGQRVLLRAPNNLMLAACWFAVLKAGGIVVCTMPLLRERELQYILGHARVSLAITDDRFADELVRAAGRTPVIRFSQLTAVGASSAFANVRTAADDVAIIAYTSGTTGEAKGTVHFHRDMIACCDCWPPYVLQPAPEDIFCGSPPFAFTFGLGGLVLFPMRIGASSLLLEQATPPQLLAAIQEFRPTISFTSPTAYRAMLSKIQEFDVSSLRACVSAGEPLPLATFEAWKAATGIEIIDGIGSTEMLHIFISASGRDIRPGSTGKVVPGYTARIVDDNMRDVPVGEIGKLAVRGPTGCRYLANEERQRSYVRDGWNLTGDAYRMDADGYFWYQARSDDMIISSGYNISGPEVENVLLEHPAVLECGVVGVPHDERGQIVKAFIVLKPDVSPSEDLVRELQEHVKQQIAPYKYPRAVQFCDSLPRTNTGKLQRFKLRELSV
ncbi:MAG TPA: AMP-binding protein [Longimicrobiales bacterium]|nr:AMP-binding protein [Longimicrobiales bacterium]